MGQYHDESNDKDERTASRYDSATTRARAFRLNFISLISLSTSSINLVKRSDGYIRHRDGQRILRTV